MSGGDNSSNMEKLDKKQKNLLKQCKYYKGEKECPFPGDYTYESLASSPKAYWWHAEKEAVDMGLFDSIDFAIDCKIYKHMDMCPMSEDECLKSYRENAI